MRVLFRSLVLFGYSEFFKYVREITPSEGYLLNDTVYRVGADPKDYTVEYNNAPDMTVMEQVIKGKISIIKHTDDGENQIETPEKGAEFQVYLKSSGSFVNADKHNEIGYFFSAIPSL